MHTASTPLPPGFHPLYPIIGTGPSGYAATFSEDCSGFIAPGEAKTCTITNGDIALDDATLTVFKVVVNDNGGTAVSADFIMTVNLPGGGSASFPGTAEGTTVSLLPGDYSVSESGLTAYAGELSAGCSGIISAGENATCVITNNDIAPILTLVKIVVNDDGGTEPAGSWTHMANGPSVFSGAGPSVSSDASFLAGTYSLSESGPGGYSSTGYICDGGIQVDQTIQLAVGDHVTCTITNDDIPPRLTLTKVIVPADASGTFNLYIESPDVITIAGVVNVADGGTTGMVVLPAGTYTIGETGYGTTDLINFSSSIDCGDGPMPGPAAEITLLPGDAVVCTITNTYVTPEKPGQGFMTGGGNVTSGKGKNAQRFTWGFMVRCGADSLGNYRARFQFNDHYTKTRFHLQEVTSVECTYDDSMDQGNPNATFNKVTLTGWGRVNGESGYYMEIVLTDNGEPLRRKDPDVDTVQLTMMASDEISILYATGAEAGRPGKPLSGGNHQAHGGPPETG